MNAGAALFTPWSGNGLSLPNRLAVAPMTRISAMPDGTATGTMARYYRRFAEGGFGLVITEGIYTDQAYAQGYANQPGMTDRQQAESWRPVVTAVQAAGGKIFAQLMHAGALSQFNRFGSGTIGPSAVRPKGVQLAIYQGAGPYGMPRAMTENEITEAISGFAQAAALAIEVAGFDGIEIHGANGYLLDQFLTDYTNLRSDAWGGSIDRRLRLSVQVLQAARQAVPSTVPVGIRISQAKVNDFDHKWMGGHGDAASVFKTVAAAAPAYIHVTEHQAWQPAFGGQGPSLVSLARQHAPGVTIVANGALHDPVFAGRALGDGADLIALGRGALADSAWPQHVKTNALLATFDPALLLPLAHIKPQELSAQA